MSYFIILKSRCLAIGIMQNEIQINYCIVLYCIADAENAKESKNGSPRSIKCKSKDRNVRKVKTKVLCKNKVAIQSLD